MCRFLKKKKKNVSISSIVNCLDEKKKKSNATNSQTEGDRLKRPRAIAQARYIYESFLSIYFELRLLGICGNNKVLETMLDHARRRFFPPNLMT